MLIVKRYWTKLLFEVGFGSVPQTLYKFDKALVVKYFLHEANRLHPNFYSIVTCSPHSPVPMHRSLEIHTIKPFKRKTEATELIRFEVGKYLTTLLVELLTR